MKKIELHNTDSFENVSLDIYLQADEKENVRNLGGRPVGTTIVEQKERKENYMRMMNEICKKYCEVKLTSRKMRVKKGEVEKLRTKQSKSIMLLQVYL